MTVGRLIGILEGYDSNTPLCVESKEQHEYDIETIDVHITYTSDGDDTEFILIKPCYDQEIKF